MLCHTSTVILMELLVILMIVAQPPPNNVCPTYRDYFTIKDNFNCWHNFAADSKVPDIIRRTGFPFQQYKVQTKDGYILTVFRIPSLRQDKSPVFIMHGMQSTSAIFVSLGRDSLAFLLAEAGHDVWLGNYRGNEYSEGHATLNSSQRKFWSYGADEIGLIDVPSMINLVRFHTHRKGKIIYIGHSLGTSAAMMYASEYPEHARANVKLFIWMSPAYKLRRMRSPYRAFFPLLKTALSVTNNLNLVQVISSAHIRSVTRPLCLSSPAMMLVCLNLLDLFVGPFTQISPETVPILFNGFPGGTSLKTIIFLADSVRGQFRKYDYGGRNMFLYGNSTPPSYDVTKIQVPVFIFYARHDWATTKQDALSLWKELPQEIQYGIYEISTLRFGHFDFCFGRDARKLVYEKILKVIDTFPGSIGMNEF